MFNISELISDLIYTVPAIFIALSCHEFGHAYAAYKMGDLSQKENGRLTLNPFRHLDSAGTLCLLLFHVGWGKPVQVDPYFFKDKKQGMIWTAVAGPLVNLVLGFVFILLDGLLLVLGFHGVIASYLHVLFQTTAVMNIGLGVFNLIPLPPLDGSKVLMGILPEETYFKLMQYEMYFSLGLLLLLFTGVLDASLNHAISSILRVYLNIVGAILGIFI